MMLLCPGEGLRSCGVVDRVLVLVGFGAVCVNGVSDLMAFALRRDAISASMERGKKI